MSAKGTYHLLYYLPQEARLRVGSRGTFLLPAGWYVYTGSAFGPGGLDARVSRHRRQSTAPGGANAKPHWHVDALAGAAELVDVALLPDTVRRECEHAQAIREMAGASVPVPRFGASDCRCPAHLAHFACRPPLGGSPVAESANTGVPEGEAPAEPCRATTRLPEGDTAPDLSSETQLLAEVDAVLARRFAHADAVAEMRLRVGRELLGDAIGDLCRQQRGDPRWSPRALARALEHAPLPSLAWLREDRQAQRYASAYLRLVVRLVVLNEVEERIHQSYPHALSVPRGCYRHTESLLAALIFLNGHAALVEERIRAAGLDAPDREYAGIVHDAILLADSLYDPDLAAEAVEGVNSRRLPGGTPLGAEMEFGVLGARSVRARPGADPLLDSLFHFHDFDLGRRLRKMGGHRDDHTGVTFDASRSRGFLEIAPGRLQLDGDLSQPATTDVGVLAELIRQTVEFTGIPPHSLHLSLEAQQGRPFTRLEDPEPLVCLLLLGGDLGHDAAGVLRERRVHGREILTQQRELAFSRLNSHACGRDSPPTPVVEFTFPRLAPARPYEALILALKGLQWATNPLPLVAPSGTMDRRAYRETAGALAAWAAAPQPVSSAGISAFVDRVERGLREERAAGPGHPPGAIAEGVAAIERRLREANGMLRDARCHA